MPVEGIERTLPHRRGHSLTLVTDRSLDLADPDDVAALRARLGARFTGRPVICGPGVLAGYVGAVAMLADLGARRPLMVVTHRGAGPVPSDDEVDLVWVTPPTTESVTEELRAHDRLVRRLPREAEAAITAYDPEREGAWFTSPFVTDDEPIDGRPVYGGRPAAWLALEDKLVAERVWDALGVPHAPTAIVTVETENLETASAALDQGQGVVWTGDARDGFNGGGNFVRWVVTEQERREAAAFFVSRCDQVRVMPFLEGVPCSIHGMVLPDGTAAFRPVEIAMLRDPGSRKFVYGGLNTYWDPSPADREEMRALVSQTGEHLRAAYCYRGAFGIDGVLTADGFRPTELNTRMSAGLANLARCVDHSLFTLLQIALVAGDDPGLDVAALETAVAVMDAHRTGKAVAVGEGLAFDTEESFDVAWDGTRLTRSLSPTGSTLVVGPTPTGLFAKIEPCELLTPGDRLAPLNAGLLRLLDEEYAVGFGPVVEAPDVRSG